jgi:hypothetical protein
VKVPEFTSGTGRGRSPLRQGKSLDGECRPDSEQIATFYRTFEVVPDQPGDELTLDAEISVVRHWAMTEA